jgi:hypothetical protein
MASSFKSNQKTVRAFEEDIELINQQAAELNCTAAEVIHQMCQGLRREQYARELGESFDYALQRPVILSKLNEEIEEWDCTAGDGISDAD